MKCKNWFSSKRKEIVSSLSSAEFVQSMEKPYAEWLFFGEDESIHLSKIKCKMFENLRLCSVKQKPFVKYSRTSMARTSLGP